MIEIDLDYKAGYPGKDSQRAKAQKWFGESEMKEARSFKTPSGKKPESKRAKGLFAEGGRIKKADGGAIPMSSGGLFKDGGDIAMARGGRCHRSKFAMGGVAKIRLGQSTPSGKPVGKRGSQKLKDTF